MKKYFKKQLIFFQLDKKYKPTDPRSSTNPEHKKHENYTKAHKITQNQ